MSIQSLSIQFFQVRYEIGWEGTSIPVGNILTAAQSLKVCRDHPHTCGEYRNMIPVWLIPEGSHTHVGNTAKLTRLLKQYRDHPHTCGEYRPLASRAIRNGGSPPHMWGIHSRKCRPPDLVGITPTHVGNTLPFVSQVLYPKDHPHTCGEYCR